MPDRPEKSGDETGAEEHEDRDPVRSRGEEHRAEQREGRHDRDRAGDLERGRRDPVRPPVHRQSGDDDRNEIHRDDVRHRDGDRAEETRKQERRTADRTNHERLQQSALCVAPHRAEREEDRKHDAEEHCREEGESGQECRSERARIDGNVARHLQSAELAVDVVIRDPEEHEKRSREQQDDREHAPAQRLAQNVADDDGDGVHDVSPPTASR